MFKPTLAALVLAASAQIANAGPLTGQTLGASGGFKPASPGTAVVGAGVEFTEVNIANANVQNDLLFDFDEQGLVRVSFVVGVPAQLGHLATDNQVFSDINGTIANIIGFDLLSVSGVTGLDASDLTFTADSVAMSLGSGSVWTPNAFFTAQIRFADPVPVPEPQTLALVGLALVAAGIARRRAPAA